MNKSIKEALSSKWLKILEEYEKVKQKRNTRFRSVEDICEVYSVSRKDIQKYYGRWIQSGRSSESLIPRRRGPKPGTTKILSKEEERIILKIQRKLNANEHEIFHLTQGCFTLHPSVSTIYRTLKRFPLNKERKKLILRYEKRYPGELGHSDLHYLPKEIFIDKKKRYLFGLMDDCTRLCHVQVIPDFKSRTVVRSFFESCKWFQAHGITYSSLLTDNGTEFTTPGNTQYRDQHIFEIMLDIFSIKHKYTKPRRPQTNGKIERFWRIFNEECLRLIQLPIDVQEFIAHLNGFIYRYNYQRIHSGLKYITPLDKLISVTELLK